ncbi:MAG: glycosyltransferase family 2 protein [Caulobacteraceae bacterium]
MTVESAIPKISVCIITYNHSAFIGDCLKSVVDQQTDFPFEIIVGDDCSTDGASEIVQDYAYRFPGLIKVLHPDRNRGATQNYLTTHNAARGEYVAHMDGDDLALPGKLARQAALLDSRPDLVACGHKVGVILEDGTPTGESFPRKLEREFHVGKVIKCGMPFITSSLMYRRAYRSVTTATEELFDWYLLTDIMSAGRGGYLSEQLGLYRVNPKSATGSLKRKAMRVMMLEMYARRFVDLPGYRAEFFAAAFFDFLACVRDGAKVVDVHRDLLRESFGPRGLVKAFDTFVWRWQNARALSR